MFIDPQRLRGAIADWKHGVELFVIVESRLLFAAYCTHPLKESSYYLTGGHPLQHMFAMPSRKKDRLILLIVERIISFRNAFPWEASK
jgi:hypothetical protein